MTTPTTPATPEEIARALDRLGAADIASLWIITRAYDAERSRSAELAERVRTLDAKLEKAYAHVDARAFGDLAGRRAQARQLVAAESRIADLTAALAEAERRGAEKMRQAARDVANGWIAAHGGQVISYVPANEYAADAVLDIVDAIANLPLPSPASGESGESGEYTRKALETTRNTDELREPPPRDEGVDAVLAQYSPFINARPELLSLLYDIDMLPEQTRSHPGAVRLAGLCEVWKRMEAAELALAASGKNERSGT